MPVTSGSDNPEQREGKTFRMSELVSASGASRDMIKYYLRAGLLPPAHKPRPNLSLYTVDHLALIGLVRKFQAATKLSLQEIADVFCAADYDTSTIEIELLSAKHSVGGDDNIIPIKRGGQNSRALEIPGEFLHLLYDAGLLAQTDNLDEDEEQLAGLLFAAHQSGVPLRFFREARETLTELADLEVRTLIAIRRPELSYAETVDNVTDVDRIINRWMIAEKNGQIRRQFQRVVDNSERAISTLLDTIYIPSALFRERHGVEGTLHSIRGREEALAAAGDHSHGLCIALLLLAEYGEAIAIAEAIRARDPGDDVATAIIALAHGMQGDVDRAHEYGALLANSTSRHAVVLQARMLSLLQRAAKLGGVADTSELLKAAGELFLLIPTDPPADQPEMALSLARANVAFPDFANTRPEAIRALHTQLDLLEAGDMALPELPVDNLLESLECTYRIYLFYYLGRLHEIEGNSEEARDCFQQVVQLDPASNFGESAYLKLGQAPHR